MATYKILYWQEVPSQIKAEDDARRRDAHCCPNVHGADRPAGRRSAVCRPPTTTWPSGTGATKQERDGSAPGGRRRRQGRARGRRPTGKRSTVMPVDAHRQRPDDRRRPGHVASSTHAERARRPGPDLVRQAGQVQGVRGRGRRAALDCSRRRPPPSATSTGPFRLSCQARSSATPARFDCHTMRRGQMRIERARARPAGAATGRWPSIPPSPGTATGSSSTASEIDRSPGPIHGLAIDLGHDDGRAAPARTSRPANSSPTRRSRTRSASAARTSCRGSTTTPSIPARC